MELIRESPKPSLENLAKDMGLLGKEEKYKQFPERDYNRIRNTAKKYTAEKGIFLIKGPQKNSRACRAKLISIIDDYGVGIFTVLDHTAALEHMDAHGDTLIMAKLEQKTKTKAKAKKKR
jgi:hypothetical protein